MLVLSEGDCQRCGLGANRTNLVVGKGNPKSNILFVGEAPGETEDKTGEPFCGRAGKMLDNILKACGVTLEDVYITNTVMCRPPQNRNPLTEEVEVCREFLYNKIISMRPKLIIALGKVAANWFIIDMPRGVIREWNLKEPMSLTDDSIRETYVRKYKLLHVYHPAALLYDPGKISEMNTLLGPHIDYIKSVSQLGYVEER